MDQLLGELQSHFVKVAKLALNEEEELVVEEGGLASDEEPALSVLLVPQGDEAFAIFVVNTFVDEEVFTDDYDPTGAGVAWDLDEHMG